MWMFCKEARWVEWGTLCPRLKIGGYKMLDGFVGYFCKPRIADTWYPTTCQFDFKKNQANRTCLAILKCRKGVIGHYFASL